jgi:quercetin dioxygenase-like cupin family protein
MSNPCACHDFFGNFTIMKPSPRLLPLLFTLFAFAPALAQTAAPQPQPILPDSLKWFGPPNNPALRAAWVLGSEKEAGPYLLRVTLAKGGKIVPHTHPDTRNSTVLSGTLWVGFGEHFDEAAMVAVPTGGVYVAPANVAHYLWARDGEVVYQEAGNGPTATLARP